MPPLYAASIPRKQPTIDASNTEVTPMISETCAPYTTREKMSRPYISVPNQCAELGSASLSSMAISLGSTVAIKGANSARITKSSVPIKPNKTIFRAVILRRNRRRFFFLSCEREPVFIFLLLPLAYDRLMRGSTATYSRSVMIYATEITAAVIRTNA